MTKDKIINELGTTKNLVRWEIDGLNLNGVDFSGADLANATFHHCRLNGAAFTNANLHGVVFEGCAVHRLDLAKANLQQARFVHCAGLTAADMATVEQRGAVVEKPANRFAVSLVVVAVLAAAIALFLLAGGQKLFRDGTGDAGNAAATPAAPTIDELRGQAEQAFQGQEYARAADLYKEVLDRTGNTDVPALLQFARASSLSGKYDAATATVETLMTVAKNEADLTQAQTILANNLIRQGRKADGLAQYEKLLDLHQDDVHTNRSMLLELGTVLWQVGDTKGALEQFQRLLDISEPAQKAGVWINIALVEKSVGDLKKMEAAYRRALDDPDAPPDVRHGAILELAMLDVENGRIEAAREKIMSVLENGGDPGQVLQAARRLTDVLRAKKQVAEIETVYRHLLEGFAKTPNFLNEARVDLANLYRENGREKEALELYELVAKESPNATQRQWAAETVRDMQPAP